MADEYRVILSIEKNGQPLDNMPIVRRLIVQEDADVQIVAAPDNNTLTYHPVAAAIMPQLQLFLLQSDNPLNIELNANTPIVMNGNGLLLAVGVDFQQATPADNIQYNNPAATAPANVTGIVAGT